MQSLRPGRPHLRRDKLISRSAVCVPLPGKAFQVLRKICQGCRSKCVPCLVSVGPRWKVNCGMKRAQQFGLQFLSAKVKGDGKSPRKGPSTSLSGDWRYVGKIRQPCCSWTAKRVLAGCIILVFVCSGNGKLTFEADPKKMHIYSAETPVWTLVLWLEIRAVRVFCLAHWVAQQTFD